MLNTLYLHSGDDEGRKDDDVTREGQLEARKNDGCNHEKRGCAYRKRRGLAKPRAPLRVEDLTLYFRAWSTLCHYR